MFAPNFWVRSQFKKIKPLRQEIDKLILENGPDSENWPEDVQEKLVRENIAPIALAGIVFALLQLPMIFATYAAVDGVSNSPMMIN